VARITAAVSDIVYQCQSVASGFIAAPDATSLAKDVNALMDADRRVLSNVTFVVGSPAGITRRTTLSREIALAEHNLLTGDCSRAQAERLQRALRR
jgi:hypothetical protein